jgi:hypothetical protein
VTGPMENVLFRKPNFIEKIILKFKKAKIEIEERSHCIVEIEYKEINGNKYITNMFFWRK